MDDTQILGGEMTGPDGQSIQLSAEEAQAILDAAEEAEEERRSLLLELTAALGKKCDGAVRAKREIEKRWIDDIRQYDGDSRLLDTKEYPAQSTDDNLKPPTPHLTRARTDMWESRLIDMLVPTTELVWDLRPTPDEDADPPEGIPVEEWVQQLEAHRADCEEKCRRMKNVVRDQMAACNSSSAFRRAIRDACRIGSGLIIGPMAGVRVQRKLDGQTMQVITTETTVPEIREGDPWFFFPDMTKTLGKASYAFYLYLMSELELMQFGENPGFDKQAINDLIDTEPKLGEVAENINNRARYLKEEEETAGKWPVWRYTGIIDRKFIEALKLMPCTCEDGTPAVLPPVVVADLWYSGEYILKAKLTPLYKAKDFRIPYYLLSPFPCDDTPFGYSIPYLCRDSQRTATASWLITLHNASLSAGPQVITRAGKIVPKDGKYSLRGPKLWETSDDQQHLDDCMTVINIPNNSAQSLEIFDRSVALMDQELGTDQWANPEGTEPVPTASGMAMLLNARTIFQRRAAANADDEMFRPLIERFVLWNLLWSKRADIKGDYDVVSMCQSVRLVKDIQIQHMQQAAAMMQQPAFAGMSDNYEIAKDIMAQMDVPSERWLLPKDQWQQAKAAQGQNDPKAQLDQQRILTEQSKQKTESMRQQAIAAKAAAPAEQHGQITPLDQLKHQEFVMENAHQERVQASRENMEVAKIEMAHAQGQQAIEREAARDAHESFRHGVDTSLEMHKIRQSKPPPMAAPHIPNAPKPTPPHIRRK